MTRPITTFACGVRLNVPGAAAGATVFPLSVWPFPVKAPGLALGAPEMSFMTFEVISL